MKTIRDKRLTPQLWVSLVDSTVLAVSPQLWTALGWVTALPEVMFHDRAASSSSAAWPWLHSSLWGLATNSLYSDYIAAWHLSPFCPILLPFLLPQMLTSRTLPRKLSTCKSSYQSPVSGESNLPIYVKTLRALESIMKVHGIIIVMVEKLKEENSHNAKPVVCKDWELPMGEQVYWQNGHSSAGIAILTIKKYLTFDQCRATNFLLWPIQ